MVRITTETEHKQAHIHFIHDEDLDISVQDLTECKTVSIGFNQDLHIFFTPDQAEELLNLLAQSELIRG